MNNHLGYWIQRNESFLAMPDGLTEQGVLAHGLVVKFLRDRNLFDACGSRVFYSPEEWDWNVAATWSDNAVLIVDHEKGGHVPVFDWDLKDFALIEALREVLVKHDLYTEQLDKTTSGIYWIPPTEKRSHETNT